MAATTKCENCNTANPSDHHFCHYCGYQIQRPSQIEQQVFEEFGPEQTAHEYRERRKRVLEELNKC